MIWLAACYHLINTIRPTLLAIHNSPLNGPPIYSKIRRIDYNGSANGRCAALSVLALACCTLYHGLPQFPARRLGFRNRLPLPEGIQAPYRAILSPSNFYLQEQRRFLLGQFHCVQVVPVLELCRAENHHLHA